MSHDSTKRTAAQSSRRARRLAAVKRSRRKRRLKWSIAIVGLLLVGVAMDRLLTNDSRGGGSNVTESQKRTSKASALETWDPSGPALPGPVHHAARPMEEIGSAYAFASRKGDLLRYIPCYCGCEQVGHRSNLDCYVQGGTSDGRPTWDDHAFT